jgi:acyl dehydratase
MSETFEGAMTVTDPTPIRVTVDQLPELVGKRLGVSAPLTVDQAKIDLFAEATEDRQWIHVDPDRAAQSPYGTTIAHGFLTLSLSTAMLWQVLDVVDAKQIVNYGLEKVRFPAPVPAGASLTMTVDVEAVDEVAGGYQLRYGGTVNAADVVKPVCVMSGVLRYYRTDDQ